MAASAMRLRRCAGSMAWYNENDLQIAAWLRELQVEGLIPSGMICERSIEDIRPEECAETSHFFAGIGGWAYALQLARWPSDAPVWTGSCPCQPFSLAGKRKGFADPRHLWPAWKKLIAKCRPPTIFGEQVAGNDGRKWLDRVRSDLEAMGYAVGSADLCAASVGAPEIRQRLWWVADATGQRRDGGESSAREARRGRAQNCGGLGNTNGQGPQRWGDNASKHSGQCAFGPTSPWSEFDLIPCADGKARRIEPGSFPLAHGVPARVLRLRGYGNAIVPQVAAAFIKAFMSCE